MNNIERPYMKVNERLISLEVRDILNRQNHICRSILKNNLLCLSKMGKLNISRIIVS